MHTDHLAGLGYLAVALDSQTVIGIYRVTADHDPARPDCVTIANQRGVTFPMRAELARQLCCELPASVRLGDALDATGKSLA